MSKDHYKYYAEDLDEALNYINHGIIPRGYRKDRFRAKYEGVTYDPTYGKLRYNNKPIVYQEHIPETIKTVYRNPNFGLINPDHLYLKMRQSMVGITREQVRKEVGNLEMYQVHKPITRQKVKKAILATKPNQHWQIDLTSMPPYHRYKYIIVIIDIFSKNIYTKAIINKTSRSVIAFLREVFEVQKPKVLQSDRGREFVNDNMKQFLEDEGVKQVLSKAYTPTSQSYVERTNRTIKGMLFRGMTSEDNNDWVSLLPYITSNYNNTYHSSIGMKPDELVDADKTTVKAISKDFRIRARKSIVKHHRNFSKLEKGDLVRIQMKLNRPGTTFAKHYTNNWSQNMFLVERVKRGNKVTQESYYVNGSYMFRNELQKVPIINRRVHVHIDNRWELGTVTQKKDLMFLVSFEDGSEQWVQYNENTFLLAY